MNSLFEDALDIPLWLERDRTLSFRERTQRDRQLGLAAPTTAPLQRVQAWWHEVDAGERPDLGAKLKVTRAWLSLLLCAAGALFGSALALAVLRYDGQHPVNVVAAVALLVAVPLAMLFVSLLLIPGRIPGLRTLQDAVATVNVGNLAASVFNRFAANSQSELKLDWSGARAGPLAQMAKWQVLVFSQLAALSFSVAATATGLALVVFTDLAFGWSTTLDITPRQAHQVVEVVSWPWAQWLGDAVPDPKLVEESRFFRLASDGTVTVAASRLTGWWPFLLMSLLIYGVLPRCVLLVVSRVRLNTATRAVLLEDPGVRALLDRMNSALLDSEGEGEEAPAESPHLQGVEAAVKLTDPVRVIAWNLAPDSTLVEQWLTAHLANPRGPPLFVGGDRELAEDTLALTAITDDDPTMALVLVKSWEPPLLDCTDLLRSLRARLGHQVSVIVVPLGLDGGAPTGNDLSAWRQTIGRLADPGTYVETFAESQDPT